MGVLLTFPTIVYKVNEVPFPITRDPGSSPSYNHKPNFELEKSPRPSTRTLVVLTTWVTRQQEP